MHNTFGGWFVTEPNPSLALEFFGCGYKKATTTTTTTSRKNDCMFGVQSFGQSGLLSGGMTLNYFKVSHFFGFIQNSHVTMQLDVRH